MTEKNKLTTVLFDLDGTITDSLPLIRETFKTVFGEMQIPWGQDEVMKWVGRTLKDIAVNFAGADGAQHFIERYQNHYHRKHDQLISLFPGTLDMLSQLKESGYKTGIVTSKGRPGTIKALKFTGVDSFMDVVITAQDVDRHKPLPDPIFKAMESLGVNAGNVIYIGDTGFDLKAGKAAGVKTLGVSWGVSSEKELLEYEPVGVIKSWEQLGGYLS